MPDPVLWTFTRGAEPVVLTAIHAGHRVRESLAPFLALSTADRLREEDPFTERWVRGAGGSGYPSIVVHHSRFECDLNRPRDSAVYQTPEDAWGLTVFGTPLPQIELERSLTYYDTFYRKLERFMEALLSRHERLVVLDIHSYNHRRDGPAAPPAPVDANPEFNVGTATLADRAGWLEVIATALAVLREAGACGRSATVGENVKFGGGFMARRLHGLYHPRVCVLSLEVKKFFMDEWTGVPDEECIESVRETVARLVRRMKGVL